MPTDWARSLALVVFAALAAVPAAQQDGPPYSPQAALGTFRLADGFQIEVFAAEPLISDPIAMEVDESGRTFVLEMHGYPLDVAGSGRVVLLTDANRDGTPDKRIVFAEGLRLPTGLMRWKAGLIVTDPPDVVYFEDTNGDGRADVRRVMLTGFARTNPQHTMNSPIYGLDNWIYLANEGPVRTIRYHDELGDPGKEVRFTERGDRPTLPVDAGGRNVRFRPDSFDVEMLSSRGQFGQTFDAWGHHFLNTNNRHIFQELIPARYLSRNPAFPVSTVVEQLPDYRQPADVFPITRNPEFQLLTDVGVMTSASGITYYLGDLFPSGYRNAAFVAESAHNLVHVASVHEHGVTFRASRMFDGREFLASTDPWFRPVNFYLGPDGALYVIDFYREIIEHPEWLDDATAKSDRLYAGRDRGRIYRIVPTGTPAAAWVNRVDLARRTAAAWVAALGEANIWWRRTAQRLLVDRKPAGAIAPLTAMAVTGESPAGRVHALWTLEGFGKLDPATIETALDDRVPGVRENAIQLAELHLRDRSSLAARLMRMTNDPSPKVRYQLLLTLGGVAGTEAADARNRLLFANVEEEWMQVAALSASGLDPLAFWHAAIDRIGDNETAGRRALFARIGSIAGASRETRVLSEIVKTARSGTPSIAWWLTPSLEGFAEGLRGGKSLGREGDPERTQLAAIVLDATDAPLRRGALQVLEASGLPADAATILANAQRLVSSTASDADARADAVRLLAIGDATPYQPLLRDLIARAEPAPVQVAAVRALGSMKDPRIASTFVELWNRWTPAVRNEAVRALVRDPSRIRVLLDAVGAGTVRPTEIDRSLRIRMMMVDDTALRDRARVLFGESGAQNEQRAAVVARYQAAESLAGDAARGSQVFGRVCATCHQYRGANGAAFGPDLGEVRNRLPHALVTDILRPNLSIADRYELWNVDLSDGTAIAGVIGGETPSSVTVRVPGGGETIVPRSRIASMRASNVSAMPEGLESQIDMQQMADLIAFLKSGARPR